jgi:TPR repeat protein
MRISDMRWGLLGALLAAGMLTGSPSLAQAVTASANISGNGDEHARAERAFRDGHVADGIETLQSAARRGGIKAQLQLARIYAEGKIIPRDEVRACELFSTLADRNSQIDRTDAAAKQIAEAFRAWAMCYVKGASAPGWERNLSRAAVLFYQAGVMLDDAESLHELAKMFLTGQGIAQNSRLAVHYFFSAARKRYAPAQALLGNLMWEGKVLKRQPVNGLALIVLALEGAKPEDKAWIDGIHQEALLTASKEDEAQAIRLAQDWKKAYETDSTGSTAPLIIATPPAQLVPPPVRAPGAPPPSQHAAPTHQPGRQQIAVPTPPLPSPSGKSIEQNTYGTLPTGADLPPAAAPAAE